MFYYGNQQIFAIISHLIFIMLTFWSMQSLHTHGWIKKNFIPQARLLFMLVAIAIGYLASSFFLEVIFTAQMFGNLF